MHNNLKYYWYIWAKALGDKPHINARISDSVAAIRTIIVLVYLVTNLTIVAGIIHHW